jgi:hypothetical protein
VVGLRHRVLFPGLAGLTGLLLLACNAGGDGDGFDFSTDSNGPGGGISSGGTAADTTGSGTDAPMPTTTSADTGGSSGGGLGSESSGEPLPPAEPCTAIDMIVVVDNSEPMLEEQIRLRATALAFILQVQVSIPTLTGGLNIGVLTTDDDLFVQPSGEGCDPYEGGNTWMVSSSLALQTELDCALNVGTAGSPDERPMDMLIGSLSDENLVPNGFHNGFLREDALLVVVLVTNEEDDFEMDTSWGSSGNPADWVAAVAGQKGGFENDVVVLSLLGTPKPNACPDFQWDGTDGAEVSGRLIDFTESFPQGIVGDICAQEYATFTLGVVPGVVAACAAYVPP